MQSSAADTPLMEIPFNKPHIAGKELYYIAQAVTFQNLSGDGHFTNECSRILEEHLRIPRLLMTTSCTSGLELACMLCNLQPGDEVIMPSFNFVSGANAVVRLGGRPVFVDIRPDTLNIDEERIEEAITPRTRALMPVHYAGVGCEMDRIMELAARHGLMVIEDAAQGVNAFYRGRSLGSIGHLGAYSFHETKNFICGEGGTLNVNDTSFLDRAEILRDKGTNRKQFFRGEVDKYTWVDVGSSYVPSEIVCAFLYAQLEVMNALSDQRRSIFARYVHLLEPLEEEGLLRLPRIPDYCQSNHHIFYILLRDRETRDALMRHLNQKSISAVIHYVPLHSAPMARKLRCGSNDLPNTDDVSGRLLRLPFYYDLSEDDQLRIAKVIRDFLHR